MRATILSLLLLASTMEGQYSLSAGAGLSGRTSDSRSMSSTNQYGIAVEVGAARRLSARHSVRVDWGHQAYPVTEAIPSCVPGAECHTMRSLASGGHVVGAIESQGMGALAPFAILGGVGAYWTSTSGGSSADGYRRASAVGLSAGGRAGFGRISVEGRLHVPIGDLAEAQWMAIGLLRLRVL